MQKLKSKVGFYIEITMKFYNNLLVFSMLLFAYHLCIIIEYSILNRFLDLNS